MCQIRSSSLLYDVQIYTSRLSNLICLLFSFQGMNRTYEICTFGTAFWPARRFARHQHPGMSSRIVPDCSSHAKHVLKNVWQPPALPCRLQHSTIGRTDLHRRVRDGNGCALRTHRHQTDFSRYLLFPSLHENPTEMQPLLHSSLRTVFYPLERR